MSTAHKPSPRVASPASSGAERVHPRAARPVSAVALAVPAVMGNRAFMRAWAARRAQLAAARPR